MYAVHYIIATLCGISCLGHIDKFMKKQMNNDTENQGKENKTTKKENAVVRIEPPRVNYHIQNPDDKTARLSYHRHKPVAIRMYLSYDHALSLDLYFFQYLYFFHII